MKQKELLDAGLLLKCPGYGKLNGLTQYIVKEALISFLLDEADPTAELDDQYYYNDIQETVYDEDGGVRNGLELYSEQEWFNFASDPTGHVLRLQEEVKRVLETIMAFNADEILAAYRELSFTTLYSNTDLSNHILFRIHGATT